VYLLPLSYVSIYTYKYIHIYTYTYVYVYIYIFDIVWFDWMILQARLRVSLAIVTLLILSIHRIYSVYNH